MVAFFLSLSLLFGSLEWSVLQKACVMRLVPVPSYSLVTVITYKELHRFLWSASISHLILDKCHSTPTDPHPPVRVVLAFKNSLSASHDNWCTVKLLNRIITAQWEGMGNVGSARYEPAPLPPCPTIRVLRYSNCQRSTHSHQQFKGFSQSFYENIWSSSSSCYTFGA